MSLSLYKITVPSYLQVLDSVLAIASKAEAHYAEQGLDLAELLATRLHPDMLPFHFQLVSVAHHSLGAIHGIQAGVFGPPPKLALDFAGLVEHVASAKRKLQSMSEPDIDALAGKKMVFKVGKMEVPFVAEHFITSFSLPNFYFHATTAYDILRIQGLPLGKLDYLGQMRTA